MTPKEQVYKAIESERSYQKKIWQENESSAMTIGEEVLLLEEYINQARQQWAVEKRPEVKTLNMIRKIAAIAIRCMESHGAPMRHFISWDGDGKIK